MASLVQPFDHRSGLSLSSEAIHSVQGLCDVGGGRRRRRYFSQSRSRSVVGPERACCRHDVCLVECDFSRVWVDPCERRHLERSASAAAYNSVDLVRLCCCRSYQCTGHSHAKDAPERGAIDGRVWDVLARELLQGGQLAVGRGEVDGVCHPRLPRPLCFAGARQHTSSSSSSSI